jgi:hypothetical protein
LLDLCTFLSQTLFILNRCDHSEEEEEEEANREEVEQVYEEESSD